MGRLHREVMQVLIPDIVEGRIAPTELLPREADLTKKFDVSRGVARETSGGSRAKLLALAAGVRLDWPTHPRFAALAT
jgi:regulatory GntR family protein